MSSARKNSDNFMDFKATKVFLNINIIFFKNFIKEKENIKRQITVKTL